MKSRVIWLCALALLMLILPFSLLAGYLKIGETPESVLQAVIRANSEKDLETLEKHMAKDQDLVLYSVGGRKYVGWKEVAQALKEESAATCRLDVTITDITVGQQVDVA